MHMYVIYYNDIDNNNINNVTLSFSKIPEYYYFVSSISFFLLLIYYWISFL